MNVAAAAARGGTERPGSGYPVAALTGALLAASAVGLLFLDTTISIVGIWARSETFTHGFFVLPLFLWLVWREREALRGLPASGPDWRPLPLIAAAGALWLVSRTAGVLVGEQLALVLMIILAMHVFLGRAIARALRFPLWFLLFLAPVGEELVPPLMDVTADITVLAIGLTGIPIYRDGLFFSLPSGDWSVVEACSGIRYLIASVMLGSLYACLSYRRTRWRLAFIFVSAVVPILANGLRAFLIVMIGHFSDMTLATGVDHLVYGWLFFGVVMFVLFSIGAMFREPDENDGGTDETAADSASVRPLSGKALADQKRSSPPAGGLRAYTPSALAVAACAGLWPLWSYAVDAVPDPVSANEIAIAGFPSSDAMPPVPSGSGPTDWRPLVGGHDLALTVVLKEPVVDSEVLALAYAYAEQRQGKEMISSSNVLVSSRDSDWRRSERTSVALLRGTDAAPVVVEQTRLRSSEQDLIVWRWYRAGTVHTSEPWRVKLLETRDRLLLRSVPSVMYVLAVDAADAGAETALARAAAIALGDAAAIDAVRIATTAGADRDGTR